MSDYGLREFRDDLKAGSSYLAFLAAMALNYIVWCPQ